MKNYTIAFIDPIISPIYLATELHRYPIKTVAVFSLSTLSEDEKRIRFHPELFDHVIYLDVNSSDSMIQAVNALKALQVEYVFYGFEGSIPLADQISQLVCPAYANDPDTCKKREDKYQMQEALKEAGIPSVKQMKIIDALNIDQMVELKSWHFPVIIKPIHGSVSVGVKKCHSIRDIEQFLKHEHMLLDSTIAKEFVIQEYLVGDEYFVDTFSLNGEHHLVSVNRYQKFLAEGHPIYLYAEIIDPNSAEWKQCADYTLSVLQAVGLNNGFGHAELFLTTQGPRLVEINCRISGASGLVNKLAEKTLHTNQVHTLVSLLNLQPYSPPQQLFQNGLISCLQCWQPRVISALNINLLTQLTSYSEHITFKNPGTHLDKPKTLLDTVGMVLLVNPDKEQLKKDYAQLIIWEKDNKLF